MKGILLIDKPSDWTSSDVVAKLRGILREKRIGHSGTLDPMATGLLVVMVGRATRAMEYAESHSKRYTASIRFGLRTDTEDTTGKILSETEADVGEDELKAVLEEFKGEISQVPPMYSAIKMKGQPLYKIARAGKEVERPARKITIDDIKIVGRDGGDYILDIKCSKGTYIRSLCRDIGERIGCGACMSALRRTEAGDFNISQAISIDDVQKAKDENRIDEILIPLDRLFEEYPACEVRGKALRLVKSGNIAKSELPNGKYRVYSPDGEFLALVQVSNGKMETLKSFFEV